jgi:inorganic triphosphatase YgiF
LKQEIEIKFEVAADKLELLTQSRFFKEKIHLMQTLSLENTYFDTQLLALNSKKIALRIRKVGNGYIQTLKTQGSSDKGLHKRLEWEWNLAENHLNTELLPKEHWPSDVDVDDLKAVFTTNFSRQVCQFDHVGQDGKLSRLEMALDLGNVAVSGLAEGVAISELELELIQGCESAVTEVASMLAVQCSFLTRSNTSKALRGYNLIKKSCA